MIQIIFDYISRYEILVLNKAVLFFRNDYQILFYFAHNLTLLNKGNFSGNFSFYSEPKCNKNTFTVATLTSNGHHFKTAL